MEKDGEYVTLPAKHQHASLVIVLKVSMLMSALKALQCLSTSHVAALPWLLMLVSMLI